MGNNRINSGKLDVFCRNNDIIKNQKLINYKNKLFNKKILIKNSINKGKNKSTIIKNQLKNNKSLNNDFNAIKNTINIGKYHSISNDPAIKKKSIINNNNNKSLNDDFNAIKNTILKKTLLKNENKSNRNSKIIKNKSSGNLNLNIIKKYNAIKKSIDNLKNDSILKKKEKSNHSYLVKSSSRGMGNDLNLPSPLSSIKNPSKSSGLDLSLSKLENDFNNSSGLSCGILNQITENIFSFGYKKGSIKSTSLETNTLFSDLENNANLPLESPFGLKVTSYPADIKNFNKSFFTFSSNRNLSFLKWDCDFGIISSSSKVSSIMQSCLDMLLCEGRYETCNYLFNGNSSFKHLQNLPNHDSGTFESRFSMADFTIRNNVLVDFGSHAIDNVKVVYKGFAIE